MTDLDAIPAGWAFPDDQLLEHALAATRAAPSDSGEHPVSERLGAYYLREGNYAGASFAELQPTNPNDVVAADLHATSLLSLEVGPRTTRRLLDDGGHRSEVLAALAVTEPTDELADAAEGLVTAVRASASPRRSATGACSRPKARSCWS